jgi:hypothetical protein
MPFQILGNKWLMAIAQLEQSSPFQAVVSGGRSKRVNLSQRWSLQLIHAGSALHTRVHTAGAYHVVMEAVSDDLSRGRVAVCLPVPGCHRVAADVATHSAAAAAAAAAASWVANQLQGLNAEQAPYTGQPCFRQRATQCSAPCGSQPAVLHQASNQCTMKSGSPHLQPVRSLIEPAAGRQARRGVCTDQSHACSLG